MSFCDPDRSVPEVARLLRDRGRLVFSHTTPWPYLAWNFDRERVTRRLRRPYFGMRRFADGGRQGTVDFQLPYGEWIRCFRRHGFVVDDLIELRAPKHARTTFADFDARWARRWPAEQVWVVRKRVTPVSTGSRLAAACARRGSASPPGRRTSFPMLNAVCCSPSARRSRPRSSARAERARLHERRRRVTRGADHEDRWRTRCGESAGRR